MPRYRGESWSTIFLNAQAFQKRPRIHRGFVGVVGESPDQAAFFARQILDLTNPNLQKQSAVEPIEDLELPPDNRDSGDML